MKLGVIADSHDRLPTLRRAVELFKRLNVDAILHAGDFVAPFAAKLIAPPNMPANPSPSTAASATTMANAPAWPKSSPSASTAPSTWTSPDAPDSS